MDSFDFARKVVNTTSDFDTFALAKELLRWENVIKAVQEWAVSPCECGSEKWESEEPPDGWICPNAVAEDKLLAVMRGMGLPTGRQG